MENLYSADVLTLTTETGQPFLLEIRYKQGREKVAGNISFSASELVTSIRPLSNTIVEGLKEISPDKFTVEFGIEAALQSGKLVALLCNGSATANLKVTLEWEKSKSTNG